MDSRYVMGTMDDMVSFYKKLVPAPGMSFDLEIINQFGYFEVKPYANESTIRYNVNGVTNTNEGLILHCTTRLGNYHLGNDSVRSDAYYIKLAKSVRFHVFNLGGPKIPIYNVSYITPILGKSTEVVYADTEEDAHSKLLNRLVSDVQDIKTYRIDYL